MLYRLSYKTYLRPHQLNREDSDGQARLWHLKPIVRTHRLLLAFRRYCATKWSGHGARNHQINVETAKGTQTACLPNSRFIALARFHAAVPLDYISSPLTSPLFNLTPRCCQQAELGLPALYHACFSFWQNTHTYTRARGALPASISWDLTNPAGRSSLLLQARQSWPFDRLHGAAQDRLAKSIQSIEDQSESPGSF